MAGEPPVIADAHNQTRRRQARNYIYGGFKLFAKVQEKLSVDAIIALVSPFLPLPFRFAHIRLLTSHLPTMRRRI